jgi:hypothetical protein
MMAALDLVHAGDTEPAVSGPGDRQAEHVPSGGVEMSGPPEIAGTSLCPQNTCSDYWLDYGWRCLCQKMPAPEPGPPTSLRILGQDITFSPHGVLEEGPTGSNDPPNRQPNIDLLNSRPNGGHDQEALRRADCPIQVLRAQACASIESALGHLEIASAWAASNKLPTGRSARHQQEADIQALEVDYHKRILTGARDQIRTSQNAYNTLHRSGDTNSEDSNDSMGEQQDQPRPLTARFCHIDGGTYPALHLHRQERGGGSDRAPLPTPVSQTNPSSNSAGTHIADQPTQYDPSSNLCWSHRNRESQLTLPRTAPGTKEPLSAHPSFIQVGETHACTRLGWDAEGVEGTCRRVLQFSIPDPTLNNQEHEASPRSSLPELVEDSTDEELPPTGASGPPPPIGDISSSEAPDSEPETLIQGRANGLIRLATEAKRRALEQDLPPSSIYGYKRCAICFGQVQDSSISCQSNVHTLCVHCLPRYVTQQMDIFSLSSDKFFELVQNEGAIKCPGPDCTCVFYPAELVRLLNKNDRDRLHSWVNKAITARNLQEAGTTVLSALFPSAIMCPQCRYGPVDHRNCDDLNAHHGQSYRGSPGIIANDCPRCHFFSSTKQDWLLWDGVIRMDPVEQDLLLKNLSPGLPGYGPVRETRPPSPPNSLPPLRLQCWNCKNILRQGRLRMGRGGEGTAPCGGCGLRMPNSSGSTMTVGTSRMGPLAHGYGNDMEGWDRTTQSRGWPSQVDEVD